MFTGLYEFLVINNFSALVTLFVGSFAFVVYRIGKTDRDKSAANIILEEIRTVERNVDKVRESGDLLNVTPSNLSTTGWHEHRHIIIKYLDYDEITQIGLFFERVEALKGVLTQWRQTYFESMTSKGSHLQITLIELAKKPLSIEEYQEEKERVTSIAHSESYWFEPHLYKQQAKFYLELLHTISTTQIGNKLKSLSNKKWYSFN